MSSTPIPLLAPLAALALFVAGCSGGVCDADGEACVCDIPGKCTWDCPDGGCEFEARNQGTATFTCDGGDCHLESSSMGAVKLYCEGGACTALSTGQGELTVWCEGGACEVTCSGQGHCAILDCEAGDCVCDSTSVTAVCDEV